MDRNDDWVAVVVAWHNRHPLARRIDAADVGAGGHVALPFFADPRAAAPGAGAADAAAAGGPGAAPRPSLRARLRERAGGRLPATPRGRRATRPRRSPWRWKAAFTERFLPPLPNFAIARFALRHGGTVAPGANATQRQIQVDPRRVLEADGRPLALLWLRTMAVDMGDGRRTRVLLAASETDGGPAGRSAVLGRRILSRARVSALALAGLLIVVLNQQAPALVDWALERREALPWVAQRAAEAALPPLREPAADAVAPAPAASAEAMAAAIAPAASAAAPVTTPPVPAVAATPPAAPSPIASAALAESARADAPQAAEPPHANGRVVGTMPLLRHEKPRIAMPLDDEARQAAREIGQAAREARAALVAAGRLPPSAPAPQAEPARATARADGATAGAATPAPASEPGRTDATATGPSGLYAVATRSLRTRFESEQMLVALRDAAGAAGAPDDLRFEVLPAGPDWRAVGWPFRRRADAERVLQRLTARGVRVELVAL